MYVANLHTWHCRDTGYGGVEQAFMQAGERHLSPVGEGQGGRNMNELINQIFTQSLIIHPGPRTSIHSPRIV